MIDIVPLNKKALDAYIHSPSFKTMPVLPISYHRAWSHIHNPSIEDGDVLLFLAKSGDQLVGYLGILPDNIYDHSNQVHHCGWMSCLWVDPQFRGQKIAQKLIQACFESWNENILLTEFTKEAGSLYAKLGTFGDPITLLGRRWYIKSTLAKILPAKKEFFKRIKPILHMIDVGINSGLALIDLFKNRAPSTKSLSEVSQIECEQEKMISQALSNHHFRRGSQELEWLLQYPWVLSAPTKDIQALKYHFTSVEKVFETKAFQIMDKDGAPVGFFIATNRNGHMRIPYLFAKCGLDPIIDAIRSLVLQWDIHTLTIYHPMLTGPHNSKNLFGALSKTVSRNYLLSKHLTEKTGILALSIQDGDGDCAFT